MEASYHKRANTKKQKGKKKAHNEKNLRNQWQKYVVRGEYVAREVVREEMRTGREELSRQKRDRQPLTVNHQP